MPSLKTIRKRITTVKSTQKITRAMKMVAGARLNRAQQRIVAMRPYALKTQEILNHVADSMRRAGEDEAAKAETVETIEADAASHPLLSVRPEKKVLYVLLSSDRGLCGAFNTNVTKAAEREWRARQGVENAAEIHFATIGRKGREFLNRRSRNVVRDFAGIYDGLDLAKSKTISGWLVDGFEKGEYDAVYLIYNEFKSAITQKVAVEQLLPIRKREAGAAPTETDKEAQNFEFLFEPNAKAVLERLVPMYVEISLYRALLESQASEFGARMTAMDAATRNAKEMISRLTLVYNRARQAAITKELMEIIGGAEALKD